MKVYQIDYSWETPTAFSAQGWADGRRELWPEELSDALRKDEPIPDALKAYMPGEIFVAGIPGTGPTHCILGGHLYVSAHFKNALERLSPGTHAFIPVRVRSAKGERIEMQATYYALAGKCGIYDIADQVDFERSRAGWKNLFDGRVSIGKPPEDLRGFQFGFFPPLDDPAIYFRKDQIRDLHYWKAGSRLHALNGMDALMFLGRFCSQRFFDELGPQSGLRVRAEHKVI